MLQSYCEIYIEISGPAASLELFSLRHLQKGKFSLDTIVQMPSELDLQMNNFVEDGYDALFGDWSKLVERRMFKEVALQHGFPFPLENREQVLACTRALGEDGEKRLKFGSIFKMNLDRYGHGYAAPWRKSNWGVECDVDEVVAEVAQNVVKIAFSSITLPKKALVALSKQNSDLNFTVCHCCEIGKRSGKFQMKKGKESEKVMHTYEDVLASIHKFRRISGIAWVGRITKNLDWTNQVSMTEDGRLVFVGTAISVEFALHRLSCGEMPSELKERFAELTDGHLNALKGIYEGRRRQV